MKTEASAQYDSGVPLWLHSPLQECKNRSVLSSWWLKLGSTAFGPPRAKIVNNEILTSYHICSQLLGQNQSIYAETESTFVITFTFTRVQKPKCPIKLMTKAGFCGFRSSPGYDSQQRDINFVSHLQSIAWSKLKHLRWNREYLRDYIHLHKSAKTEVSYQVDD